MKRQLDDNAIIHRIVTPLICVSMGDTLKKSWKT
ncbi:MAG: hypothetical protein KatS3mg030_483 [Saprospiraceae bacterium]|nr:MAG: hypothetical protein KatS3mg030_483 [Saprospiraceae bacterium]